MQSIYFSEVFKCTDRHKTVLYFRIGELYA